MVVVTVAVVAIQATTCSLGLSWLTSEHLSSKPWIDRALAEVSSGDRERPKACDCDCARQQQRLSFELRAEKSKPEWEIPFEAQSFASLPLSVAFSASVSVSVSVMSNKSCSKSLQEPMTTSYWSQHWALQLNWLKVPMEMLDCDSCQSICSFIASKWTY